MVVLGCRCRRVAWAPAPPLSRELREKSLVEILHSRQFLCPPLHLRAQPFSLSPCILIRRFQCCLLARDLIAEQSYDCTHGRALLLVLLEILIFLLHQAGLDNGELLLLLLQEVPSPMLGLRGSLGLRLLLQELGPDAQGLVEGALGVQAFILIPNFVGEGPHTSCVEAGPASPASPASTEARGGRLRCGVFQLRLDLLPNRVCEVYLLTELGEHLATGGHFALKHRCLLGSGGLCPRERGALRLELRLQGLLGLFERHVLGRPAPT
mmetsp:Transcript_18194/g.39892  ORF Transcript_18194/g.39892 Transcript_18194/m.39892 type:complete len:267 (-) Transcript_18194:1037-1837(-)